MPTGYTADISKGINFKTFALNCARAFGALITLRDEASDTPIPDVIEPSDFNLRKLNEAKARLAKLKSMTLTEADRKSAKDWDEKEQHRLEQLEENKVLENKYKFMLASAKAWIPPTPDHVGMKEFMIEQIESSIKFDCTSDYYSTPTKRLSADEWLAAATLKVERDVEYHEKNHADELKRAGDKTKWIQELKKSLAALDT